MHVFPSLAGRQETFLAPQPAPIRALKSPAKSQPALDTVEAAAFAMIQSSVHASPTVRDSALDSDLGLGGWTTLASWLLPSLESCIPTGVKTQTYSGVQNLTLQWPTEPLAWVGKIQATSLSVRHRS